MIKILIGGSPCTFWSIARPKGRETKAEGMGWELFKNYIIAKEKFQPDIFLYENNVSASKQIKEQIKKELGVDRTDARYIEIDSALVSAQSRKRFYVHNCGEVTPPADRGILLPTILCDTTAREVVNVGECETVKKAIPKLVKKYGYLPEMFNAYNVSEITSKTPTLSTGSMVTSSCATTIFTPTDKPTYAVKNGYIHINDEVYPTKLADGNYCIRQLFVEESCRLQTLPDNYCRVATERQARKGTGNGWTAEVIIHILQNALKSVPKSEEIVVLSMYDGIGTGRYCLDKMGFENIQYFAYENDPCVIEIATSNYPDIIQCGDAFALRNDDWALPCVPSEVAK